MFLPLDFFLNPYHNYIYKIILLHLTQFLAWLHFMPLSDALPAACCCCVLGNKYRMVSASLRSAQSQDPLDLGFEPFHRCLLAIIRYICWSFPLCNKVRSVLSDSIKPLLIYVINIFLFQVKTASELGIIQPLK